MHKRHSKTITILLSLLLLFQQSGFCQVATELNIAGHLAVLHSSIVQDKFRPLHLRYLSYDAQTNNFKLLLDKGSLKDLNNLLIESTTKNLLKYFFIGICLPNDSFWVNLRPDSPDNIIDDYLAQTDVGRIMLETDLQLKKDTAKATSPETPEGKLYWDKLYAKAEELFGSQDVEIPTLTRPWIVPGEIIIRETLDSAYIYKATLKVMLEQDYLKDSTAYSFNDPRLKALNEYSSQLIRELIIPKLTKEVNTAKRYAPLRQVYYSLILAYWFKARFYGKGGLYSSAINKRDLTNFVSKESWSKTTYFKEYQKSFKDGEYNIRQPIYTLYGQSIRSYFSGGMQIMPKPEDLAPFGDPKYGSSPISAVPAVSSSVVENRNKEMLSIIVAGSNSLAEVGKVEISGAALPDGKPEQTASSAVEQDKQPPLNTVDKKSNFNLLDFTKRLWEKRIQKKEEQRTEEAMAEEIGGIKEYDYASLDKIRKSVISPDTSFGIARKRTYTLERLLVNRKKYRNVEDNLDLWLNQLEAIYHARPELFTEESVLMLKAIPTDWFNENAVGRILSEITQDLPIDLRLKRLAVEALKSFWDNLANKLEPQGYYHDLAKRLAEIAVSPRTPQEIAQELRIFLVESLERKNPWSGRSYGLAAADALGKLVESKDTDINVVKDILTICENLIERGSVRDDYARIGSVHLIENIAKNRPSLITERTVSILVNRRRQITEFRSDDPLRSALDDAIIQISGEKVRQLIKQSETLRPYLTNLVIHWQFGIFLLVTILISDNYQTKLQEIEEAFTVLLPIKDKLFKGKPGAELSALGYFVIERMYESNNLIQVAQAIMPYMNEFGLFERDAFEIYSRLSSEEPLDGADGNGYLKGVGVVTKAQLDEAERTISEGGFDANNIVHILANYFSILRQVKTSPYKENLSFREFYEFLQQRKSAAKEKIYSAEELEVRGLAYEGYLVRNEILRIQQRAESLSRPLVVVENLSYGAVALAPITEEKDGKKYIVGTNIPVISAKVGSSESHQDEKVLNMDLFDIASEEMVLRDNPIVIVVDGSTSVADKERTSPHIPDSFKGYRNYFMAVNKALFGKVSPENFYEDQGFLDALEQDNRFVTLVSGLKRRNITSQSPEVYRLYFWYPGNKTLYLRVNKQRDIAAQKLAGSTEITGPAVVFIQSAIEPEVVPPNIRKRFIAGSYTPAYFDDTTNFKKFYFEYKEGYGVYLSNKFSKLARQYYDDFVRRFAEGQSSPVYQSEEPNTASSPAQVTQQKQSPAGTVPITPGGIDFRSLPIVTQAIGNLSANINAQAINRLSALNLNQELQNIERMISSGITPSSERIKEYVQVSCLNADSIRNLDKVVLCISDILRQEEESLYSTEPVLKDILVLLESGISPAELKAIFTGIKS